MNAKCIALCAAGVILLAGCNAAPEPASAPPARAETESTMTTTTATAADLQAISDAESRALASIEAAKSQALAEITETTAPPTTADPTTAAPTASVTTAVPEPKTIPLNVVTQRGDGTLTFTSVDLDYAKQTVIFYYQTSDERSAFLSNTTLSGNLGINYNFFLFQGGGNTGEIWFSNIPDFSDLSTVTLTYEFEGFDPVTVTFEIPGI